MCKYTNIIIILMVKIPFFNYYIEISLYDIPQNILLKQIT